MWTLVNLKYHFWLHEQVSTPLRSFESEKIMIFKSLKGYKFNPVSGITFIKWKYNTFSEELYCITYTTQRCSPSRAALMTGIYPFRYGLGEFWNVFFKNIPLKVLYHKTYLGCIIWKFETGKNATKERFVPTAYLDPKYKDRMNRM